MTEPRYDVVAIGNAIVDVLSPATDGFVAENGMTKGAMALMFSPEEADALYAKMGPGQEVSGGSAANTIAGMAALGSECAFIGQVADDQLGEVFAHDIHAAGIRFDVSARAGQPTTGRCLIFVTPDGQRTMNTFLGASHYLPAESIDAKLIEDARYLYLEGYLWDPEEPRAAMRAAIDIARKAGRKVAFTLSAEFVIDRHRAAFQELIDQGLIDVLFANEAEIVFLTQAADVDSAIAAVSDKVPLVVVTLSERGALAQAGDERVTVPAQPIDAVVDTTGAGDLFAAGFLHGQARGQTLEQSLTLGAVCAAEVISHFGARPIADLKELARQAL
ncbi:adenosine kinase [Sphingomonas sp. RHCKR47]|uniref:adenosine kinase n=1 Tax=Sphingomonas citricola TaxID=2862498 RepID=UPI001CA384AA|nr:adenosine kinase [Sphingomonas citricola]MBW6521929.1 adenosine kinase [Sphingomonas citricola]